MELKSFLGFDLDLLMEGALSRDLAAETSSLASSSLSCSAQWWLNFSP